VTSALVVSMAVALNREDDHVTDADSMIPKQKKRETYTGICASCQWFKASPLQRWTFGVMLLFGLATPLWIILRATGTLTGDILSGLSGFAFALYAANYFRIVIRLKEQLDKFARFNQTFKYETKDLQLMVSKLGNAVEQLAGISTQLHEIQGSYEANVGKFRALDQKLRQLGDDSVAGMGKLKKMSQYVCDALQRELLQHEREILNKCEESVEFKDKSEGLSQEEYDRFIAVLPEQYRQRFKALGSFQEVSGNDNTLDVDEFSKLCDRFAEAEAARKQKT